MAISARLIDYFEKNKIDYQTIHHFYSDDSISTAVASSIHPKMIAKAVLLLDHEGHKVMAVLPANKKVCIAKLNEEFNASYQFIKEQDVYDMFYDCDEGAVPPIGAAYNMTVICDQLLDILDNVYIEAGDHETLIMLNHDAFKAVMKNAKHVRFSKSLYH